MALAGFRRVCRTAQELPCRRSPQRAPKVHPTTGLPLSRRKGQHLLHNKDVLTKILEAADIRSTDAVYEVGCGTGELTMQLLPYARKVHTIDVEPRMVEETVNQAKAAGFTNLEAEVGDAVRVPMPRRFDLCVANLPYQLSAPFLFQLLGRLSQGPAWRAAVLMFQREFAQRLLADPGELPFSRLAISTRLFVKTTRMFDVKPGSFIPHPQVHSTVVRLEPNFPLPNVDVAEFDALVRLLFSKRRKFLRTHFTTLSVLVMMEQNYKMRCSLMGKVPSPIPFPEIVMSVLEEEDVLYERPFTMDVDNMHSLLQAFHRRGIYFINVQGELEGSGRHSLPPSGGGEHNDFEDDPAPSPHSLLVSQRSPAAAPGSASFRMPFNEHYKVDSERPRNSEEAPLLTYP